MLEKKERKRKIKNSKALEIEYTGQKRKRKGKKD